MSIDSFDREYELDDGRGTIILTQKLEGDVNCVVWDAALVLAKYLEVQSAKNPNYLKGKKILELGSGLGCVGLVAACLGGNVTLTDQRNALPMLTDNLKKNEELIKQCGGNATCKELEWGTNVLQDENDIILLADCVYYHESVTPLIQTICNLSSEKTEILFSQEDRSYSDEQTSVWLRFGEELREAFSATKILDEDQHQLYKSKDIYLYRLKKLH